MLEDLIVSKTSNTLTILFLFGVTVGPFLIFATSISTEGLKISDILLPQLMLLLLPSFLSMALRPSLWFLVTESLVPPILLLLALQLALWLLAAELIP